jgi:hypothetical protein
MLVALVVVVGLGAGVLFASGRRDIPFTSRQQVWSVGIYEGTDLLDLGGSEDNPIVTSSDIGGDDVIGVADPWLVTSDDGWYLFFEVIQSRPGAPNDQHGVIGLSTSRDSGLSWNYAGVVLEEQWHLSYPQVFSVDGRYYMVPETQQSGQITLYSTETFPEGWSAASVLMEGPFTDPTIFEHDGLWWLFATDSVDEPDDTLRLFFADDLEGPYTEHQRSPIVEGDVSKARSAGPVTADQGGLIRFAMDNSDGYGRAVRGFLITTLNTEDYDEEEVSTSPLVTGSGDGWNADGMHHLAPTRSPDGGWVAAVDGYYYERVFGFDQ